MKDYTYLNPVVTQRANPYIYKHIDGYYYFLASVPEYDRIEIKNQKLLMNYLKLHQ